MLREQIYEAGEYCEVCGDTDRPLGVMTLPGDPDPPTLYICGSCYDDKKKLTGWFQGELERFVKQSPDYEQMPNGNWRRVHKC